jgi:hypothetical protein
MNVSRTVFVLAVPNQLYSIQPTAHAQQLPVVLKG